MYTLTKYRLTYCLLSRQKDYRYILLLCTFFAFHIIKHTVPSGKKKKWHFIKLNVPHGCNREPSFPGE